MKRMYFKYTFNWIKLYKFDAYVQYKVKVRIFSKEKIVYVQKVKKMRT